MAPGAYVTPTVVLSFMNQRCWQAHSAVNSCRKRWRHDSCCLRNKRRYVRKTVTLQSGVRISFVPATASDIPNQPIAVYTNLWHYVMSFAWDHLTQLTQGSPSRLFSCYTASDQSTWFLSISSVRTWLNDKVQLCSRESPRPDSVEHNLSIQLICIFIIEVVRLLPKWRTLNVADINEATKDQIKKKDNKRCYEHSTEPLCFSFRFTLFVNCYLSI